MVESKNIAAVLCSDIHLSHRPPVARSAEPDWYEAMRRPLRELASLASKHKAPVICAGDVGDRWNCPSELVNFALAELPQMYAVPGQHDLPMHSLDDLKRTSFWTLVKAGKIIPLSKDQPIEVEGAWPVRLWGFPFGTKPIPLKDPHDLLLEVAVVHRYVWTKRTGYPGAPEKNRLKRFLGMVGGYDAVVVGDNHRGFLAGKVLNCGAMMRRKMDEKDYTPSVGLLTADGKIVRHELDCSKDKFIKPSRKETEPDMREFLRELDSLWDATIDFSEAVKRSLGEENMPEEVKRLILQSLETT